MPTSSLPPLPLAKWKSTKQTLHLYAQIVGKIRMALTPPQNHWWHVPLFVNAKGIGTGPIPYEDNRFEIDFDFRTHQLAVTTSEGRRASFKLEDGLTVAAFYKKLFDILSDLGIQLMILAKPYDHPVPNSVPFAEDTEHHRYDKKYIERYWHILMQVDRTFRIFNQNFCGKICPVQLYWHSFDLSVTRFSGKTAPPMPQAGRVDQEAYSHEVISFGFWPGDENVTDAAFYSYTFPAPEGLSGMKLKPKSARWIEQNASPMAILMYEDMRTSANPQQTLLDFLESAYQAGIQKAQWDTTAIHKAGITTGN